MRVLLLDADSIIYILAYNNRDNQDIPNMMAACDSILYMLLTSSGATHYIGAFSPDITFRNRIYRYNPYKGKRPVPDEWLTFWKPKIMEYFTMQHNFITGKIVEADDVIAALAHRMRADGIAFVIGSPDKDMGQVEGNRFSYKKSGFDPMGNVIISSTSPEQAHFNFWMQMLTGDGEDNVTGIYNMGPSKAKVILDALGSPIMYENTVKLTYEKYFGPFYGPKIYEETHATLKMMDPSHPMWMDDEIAWLREQYEFPPVIDAKVPENADTFMLNNPFAGI